jgi:hypothetical protein
VRFRTNADKNKEYAYIDDVVIAGALLGPDFDPPTPDPMTWAEVPQAVGSTSISMTASTAVDPSGVEYYFTCTAGAGHDSGWQDSATYVDTGLEPETTYTYTVTARDKSIDQNETLPSADASVTTAAAGTHTLHVASLDVQLIKAGKNWKGQATAVIHDQDNQPMEEAQVVGDWYYPDETTLFQADAFALTQPSGTAVISSNPVKAKSGQLFMFRVEKVILSGYTFEQGPNDQAAATVP